MVGGEASSESLEVLEEPVFLSVDTYQTVQGQGIVRCGAEGTPCRIMAKKTRGGEVWGGWRRGCHPFQGLGNAIEDGFQITYHG